MLDNGKITAERIAELEKLESSGAGPAAGKAMRKLILASVKLVASFENMPEAELTSLEKEFISITHDAVVSMVLVEFVSRK